METSLIYKLKMDPEEVKEFQGFFMERSGLVFEGRRIQEMENAVAGRMIALGLGTFGEYRRFLDLGDGREELFQLVLALTVGETRFFRTPDQFAALRKYVLPELLEQGRMGSRQLRILSAGCSTGEEPYSLAILLHQLAPDLASWNVRISAFDINRDYLEAAREGVYNERKLNLVDPATRELYFKRLSKNQWRVSESLKEVVEWHNLNLTAEELAGLAEAGLFHLILCRNVLIYFNADTIKKVINSLHDLIIPQGYLMLGYSETLFKISSGFQSIHTPEAFFYQKSPMARISAGMLPRGSQPYERDELLAALGSKPHARVDKTLKPEEAADARRFAQIMNLAGGAAGRDGTGAHHQSSAVPGSRPSVPARPRPRPAPEITIKPPAPACLSDDQERRMWEDALIHFAQERFREAERIFEEMLAGNPNSARAYVGMAFLHANTGAEEQSREHAERARSLDDLLPEIYFLFALLDEKCGDLPRSLKNYQRVILLSPDFALAHFNLGNLLLKMGRKKDAMREFSNTRAILERDPDNASLRFSGGLSREALIEFCGMQS